MNERTDSQDDTLTSTGEIAASEAGEATAVGWRSRRLKPVWWLAMVAVFFLALWAWTELRIRAVRAELEESAAATTVMETENTRLKRQNQQLASTLQFLRSPRTRTFTLSSPTGTAAGRVFLDPESGRLTAFFSGLPPAPAGQTYRLWLTRPGVRQPPQAVGVFAVDASGAGQVSIENSGMNDARSASVTLDPAGDPPATAPKPVLTTASR